MISSAILIAGIAGVFSGYVVVQHSYAHQQDVAIATQCAEGWMEQVVVLNPGSTHLAAGHHGTRFYDDAGHIANFGKFALTWDVTLDVPIQGMRQVKVTVSWHAGDMDHSVDFTTFRD